MGGNSSKAPPSALPRGGAKSAAKAKAKEGGAAAAAVKREARKKLDPKDYILSKLAGQSVTRSDGSISGEQFNIEECKDCDIFLVDTIATAFIDDCEGCRIFVGPVESSVFLRNCKSCHIVMACQQFRSRDCEDCKIALFCTTEPIIETSTNMQFACFDFFYFSLREQFARSGLQLWNNKWSQVYDFNKNAEKSNWSLLAQEKVSGLLNVDRCLDISPEEVDHDRVVPVTLGCRQRPSNAACLVIFLPGGDAQHIEAFLAKVRDTLAWTLCRTRSIMLNDDQRKTLFSWSKEKSVKDACKGKEVVGVEVCGDGCFEQTKTFLTSAEMAAGSKTIRLVPQEHVGSIAKNFFELFKDEI